MTNVLKPLQDPIPEPQASILKNYPQQNGYLLSLFKTFANSERFLLKGVPNLLDKESPLSLRQRELVILRVTANNNCEYEWGVHVAIFGEAAQLSADEIRATTEPLDNTVWPHDEALLISVVDQLCGHGQLDKDTKSAFQQTWSLEEQLEILALCGTYHTVSFVANVAELENEPFGSRFPK